MSPRVLSLQGPYAARTGRHRTRDRGLEQRGARRAPPRETDGRARYRHHATSEKRERLLEQGADDVVATDEEPLAERMMEITRGRGVQLAYDPIAGAFIRRYLDGLADGAKVFVYGMLGGDPTIEYPIASVLRRGITVQPYSAIAALADARIREEAKLFLTLAFKAGHLAPVVDRVFPLEDAQAAYDYMRSGKQFGKIVMKTRFAH